MNSVMLVEDDRHLGPSVKKGLEEQGYSVFLADCGKTALERLRQSPPDLLILDLGLPDVDGIELVGQVRAGGWLQPMLILTARDTTDDKVLGLDAGAEDYLVKPFAFAELLARLRSLLRRQARPGRTLAAGDLSIDLLTRHVTRNGESIDLSPREFDLLAYLALNAPQVVSRDMLAADVWRETSRFTSLDNVIDVHVSRLRRKLATPDGASPVRTVRGVGVTLDIAS